MECQMSITTIIAMGLSTIIIVFYFIQFMTAVT